MQEIHPITARLLGDRRLRHHNNHHQALKCPRCDSLNTKFCYYNNYNLSQPRHFCKNCRRYWTKGGVLRNVPVGGGCRKSKRSSKPKLVKPGTSKGLHSQSSSGDSSNNNNNNNNNNSDNGNITITAIAPAATGLNSSGCEDLFQISDAENFSIRNLDPLFESVHQVGEGGSILYPDELTGFMNVMNNNSDHNSDHHHHHHHQDQLSFSPVDDGTGTASFNEYLQSQRTAIGVDEDWGFGKIDGAHATDDQKILDQTVRIDDMVQNRGSSVGLATLDWNHTAENGFLDLPTTVDHQTYWSSSTPTVEHQHTHWSDNSNHHSLFLP